jgi:hypothetical protein
LSSQRSLLIRAGRNPALDNLLEELGNRLQAGECLLIKPGSARAVTCPSASGTPWPVACGTKKGSIRASQERKLVPLSPTAKHEFVTSIIAAGDEIDG